MSCTIYLSLSVSSNIVGFFRHGSIVFKPPPPSIKTRRFAPTTKKFPQTWMKTLKIMFLREQKNNGFRRCFFLPAAGRKKFWGGRTYNKWRTYNNFMLRCTMYRIFVHRIRCWITCALTDRLIIYHSKIRPSCQFLLQGLLSSFIIYGITPKYLQNH